MNKVITLLIFLTIAVGCADSETEAPKKYAVLTETSQDRMKLEIKDTHWTKLVGPNGLGGYRDSLFYWATLEGSGPVFQNPEFHENSLVSYPNIGSITIDRKKGIVVIELKRIVSKAGEAQVTEPNPANGTYPIK